MYGVPVGNDDRGRTDSNTDTILPVIVDMTIVAAVRLPSTTARDEARTVISDALTSATDTESPIVCGVSDPVAYGAIPTDHYGLQLSISSRRSFVVAREGVYEGILLLYSSEGSIVT